MRIVHADCLDKPLVFRRSYISGQIIAKKYTGLGTAKFVRTAKKERILESSRWWLQGFEGGAFDVAVSSLPQPNLVTDVRILHYNRWKLV
jgi:hypothetical protein